MEEEGQADTASAPDPAPAVAPSSPPLPDSLELHRQRQLARAPPVAPPAVAPPAKKPRGLGKGTSERKRYTTQEKLEVMQDVKEFRANGGTLEDAAEEFRKRIGNLSKWGKQFAAGTLDKGRFQKSRSVATNTKFWLGTPNRTCRTSATLLTGLSAKC